MAGDIILADKSSRAKKAYFVLAVVVLMAVALASFVLFGKLLRDYIVYDSDRLKATAEIESVQAQIVEIQNIYLKQKTEYAERIKKMRDDLKTRNDDYVVSLEKNRKVKALLESEVAERESKIREQQPLIDEYLTLTNQIVIIKASVKTAQDDLISARESVALEKGTLSALRTEADTLKVFLEKTMKAKALLESEVAGREAKIREQQPLVDQYLTLTNQIVVVKSSVKTAQDELKSVRESLATEKGTLSARKAEADALKVSIDDLKVQKTSVEKDFNLLADQVLMLNQTQSAVQAQNMQAKTNLSDITIQIADATNRLNRIEADYVRLRNESTKAEATLAGINAKTAGANEELVAIVTQKEELNVLLNQLAKNKATLEGEIVGLESRVKQADTTLSRLTAQSKHKQAELENAVTQLMEMSTKAITQVKSPPAEDVSTSPDLQASDTSMEATQKVTLSTEKTSEDGHDE